MAAVVCLAGVVSAQEATTIDRIPREHPYQEPLIAWIGSLTAADLTVEPKVFGTVEPGGDPGVDSEALYRLALLPVPETAIAANPEAFLLSAIETEQGVVLPQVSCSALAWLVQWDPGIGPGGNPVVAPGGLNPYKGDAGIKRQAMVWAAVDMMMLDKWHDLNRGSRRTDYLGGTLIWLGYTFLWCGDVMPEPARQAFAAGLRRMVEKMRQWGPRGAMTDMDLFAPVGLWYVAEALDDDEVRVFAKEYSRPLFTHPRFFHPAGYFVDVGGYDVSYNGISLFFAAHAAVLTRWDFVIDALSSAYELRRYLTFPEVGNTWAGPAHFSPRTSAAVEGEQWGRAVRHHAAAMFTDHALRSTPKPTPELLAAVPDQLANKLRRAVSVVPRHAVPWKETHWSSAVPYDYSYYVPGLYERRLKVPEENPEIMIQPFAREGTFVRSFADVLLAAKMPTFGVILHTGPIGRQDPIPCGFSGGAMSGFWTKATGPVFLGRRSGSQGNANPDSFANWTLWPTHSTTGTNPAGRVFSTARIRLPESAYTVTDASARVVVRAPIRNGDGAMADTLVNPIEYERTFELDAAGLTITTRLTPNSSATPETPELVTALYEMLPVYFGPARRNQPELVHAIEARVGDTWQELTTDPVRTSVIRVRRHEGAVLVTLDQPRPVSLSSEMWADVYQSRARCRNVMVDLLENAGNVTPLREVTSRIKITPE